MKSIVLFSRCELVYLNGDISAEVGKKFNVIHLAYSLKEASILKRKYGIDEVIIFKDEIEKILFQNQNITADFLEKLDAEIIRYTNNRFSLNSAIQADRGFSILNYEETLQLCQAYYIFWNSLLTKSDIEFILHEPTSLFFNHIAAVICKREGIKYLSPIMVDSDKEFSFIPVEGDTARAPLLENKYRTLTTQEIKMEKTRIENFLLKYKNSNEVFLEKIIKSKIPYFKLFLSIINSELKRFRNRKKIDRIKDNIDYWTLSNNHSYERLRNITQYYLKLNYDVVEKKENYYYYPIHLEPEAVVLYWGDGLYAGQVKLIQNIAAQLPPGTFLYVKDHPHFIGYRSVSDYLEIKKIPNLKLISPNVSGRSLIKESLGVITINGTAGVEGIFMNKPVYLFGHAFYDFKKYGVHKIANVKDLRTTIIRSEKEELPKEDLDKFVLAYLEGCGEGVTEYFVGRIKKFPINLEDNAIKISNHLIQVSNFNSQKEKESHVL